MSQFSHRYLGLASLLLVGASAFAACGGLDPRKVSKDPRTMDGDAGEVGNPGGNGPGPDAGGSTSVGGDMGNPFGGQLFEGGAPPVLDGPPSVVEVDPADMSTDVSVDANVNLLFTEAIDPATISDASVTLSNLGNQVGGDVSLDPDNSIVATINPTRRLSLAAKYDVNVSTAVTDSTGTALASAFTSSFTTRDGEWAVTNEPFVANPDQWYMYNHAFLTVDGRGNSLVVWPEPDPNTGNPAFWGRWHRVTTGWQDPVELSSGVDGLDGFSPQAGLATNESGDAVVVWREYNSALSQYGLWARRYVNGAWSQAPEPVHGDLAMANQPNLGPHVRMRGDNIVVWWGYPQTFGNNTYYYVYAQSTTVDGAWPTTPQYVGSGNANEGIYNSNFAMDAAGNGMLVFDRYLSGIYSLHFAKYVGATGAWESPAPIAAASNVIGGTPAIALDDSGAGMVVWANATGTYDLVASRYTKAKGFAAPEPLEELDTEPGLSYTSAIATDGTNFFVTWVQSVGSTFNAYGNRYSTADAAWSGAQLLSDGDTSLSYRYDPPTMVADAQGNGMAVWVQGNAIWDGMAYDFSGIQYKYARFSAAEMAWQAPQVVAGGVNYDAYEGHASAVGANGVVAVLNYSGGYSDPVTNEYVPGQPWLSVFR